MLYRLCFHQRIHFHSSVKKCWNTNAKSTTNTPSDFSEFRKYFGEGGPSLDIYQWWISHWDNSEFSSNSAELFGCYRSLWNLQVVLSLWVIAELWGNYVGHCATLKGKLCCHTPLCTMNCYTLHEIFNHQNEISGGSASFIM